MAFLWSCCLLAAVWALTSGQATTPANTVHCYQCMNYTPDGAYYKQCPLHDKVDPKTAFLNPNCTGACFTHTDDLDARLVIRGCTGVLWNFPNPLPPDGCYRWYSEIWCICTINACNSEPLGNLTSDKELDSHISYTRTDDGNSAGVRVPAVTSVLTITMVTAVSYLSRQ